MYARLNIIYGEKSKTDRGIDRIETTNRGAVEAATGNRGLTTLVDRQAGVIVAMSYWDEPLSSSGAVLTRTRQDAVDAVDGDLVAESFEVAVAERRSTPPPGAVVRMARLRLEPSRIADGIAFVQAQVLPALHDGQGFCSAELLVDRATGDGVLVTAWDDEDCATRSESVLDLLHDGAAEQGVVGFPRTETYAMVHA